MVQVDEIFQKLNSRERRESYRIYVYTGCSKRKKYQYVNVTWSFLTYDFHFITEMIRFLVNLTWKILWREFLESLRKKSVWRRRKVISDCVLKMIDFQSIFNMKWYEVWIFFFSNFVIQFILFLLRNFSPLFASVSPFYIGASNIVNLAYAVGGVAFDKRINSVFRRFLSLYKLPLVTPLTHPRCP